MGTQRIVLVTSLVAAASCAWDASGPPASEFELVDSAGVPLARNHGSAPRWMELEEVLRIGEVEGPEEQMLSGVSWLDVREDGRVLAVVDGTRIRVYDPEGRFVREMGRSGEGPGEFRFIVTLSWLPDGIAAFDPFLRKVVLFSEDGVLEQVITLRPSSLGAERAEVWGDRLFVRAPDMERYRSEVRPGRRTTTYASIYEVNRSTSELVGPIATLPTSTVVARAGSLEGPPNLFDAVTYAVMDGPDRYVGGHGIDYNVEVRSLDGRLLRRITRDFEPVPLDDEAFGRYRDAMERRYGGPRARGLEEALDRWPEFDHVPPLSHVAPGEDGGYWVRRQDLYRDPVLERTYGNRFDEWEPEGAAFDVFDPEGRYIGSVRLPPKFRDIHFRARRVTGVERDELDVEHIVSYRVRPGEGG